MAEILGRLQQQGGWLDRIEGDVCRIDDKVGHLSAAQLRQDERLGELDERLDAIIDLIRNDH